MCDYSGGMLSTVASYVAIAGYLAGALAIAYRLFRQGGAQRVPRNLGIGVVLLAAIAHGALLLDQVVGPQGINLGFFNAASLVSWTIAMLILGSALTKPVENLGILLFPLAAATIVLDGLYPSTHLFSADAPWGLRAHVLISLLAYSLLTLASVQAILLAVQDHHLRHRHPGGFIKALPPLQTMETLLFEMIGVGFVLLTLALFSGFMFLEDLFAQRLAHKTVLSIAAWLVFGTLLLGRVRFGWRGQKALIWTLVGFVVLMLAYFGSKFVIELLLNGGP
jgi:ABC-type uncharacterized transport system permease subunit